MKIVSGGQTGVDRGALDAALELGTPVGGWCPRGRRSEDGKLPDRYAFLVETPEANYLQRTRWNVRDSDATLILHVGGAMGPGTRQTIKLCRELGRAHLVCDLDDKTSLAEAVAFCRRCCVATLNVAGGRESTNPGIQARTHAFIRALILETT